LIPRRSAYRPFHLADERSHHAHAKPGHATDFEILWKAGAIEGRVVDDAGTAVAGASVEVRRRKARGFGAECDIPKQGTTDAAGRYSVTGLSPADYIVVVLSMAVSLPTSVVTAYKSALRAGGDQSRALIETLRATRVPIPLNPVTFGSSTFDLFGPDGPAPRPASTGDGRLVQTTFYPASVTVHDAAPIQVGPGQVRSDVDFHLVRRRWVRVAGSVTGPNGPAPYVGLRLVQPDDVPAEATEFTFPVQYENAETITDERGHFEFLGVSAGRYRLKAAPANRTPWLQADVTVGEADVLDLQVALRAGIRVSGHIVFDGGTAPTGEMLTHMAVARLGEVLPTGFPPPPGATLRADQSFTTPEYPPGRYVVLPQSSIPGWSLRSAVLGGRDVTLLPFTLVESDVDDLVLTYRQQTPSLVGRVRASSTLEPAETEVVVFPADFETWLKEGMPSHLPSRQTRVTHVAADGTFFVPLLAPGDYLAAALDAREAGGRGADTFRRLARVATKVTLPASGQTTLDLVPVTIR